MQYIIRKFLRSLHVMLLLAVPLLLPCCAVFDRISNSNKVKVEGDKTSINSSIELHSPDQSIQSRKFHLSKFSNPQIDIASLKKKVIFKFAGNKKFVLISKPIITEDKFIIMDGAGKVQAFDKSNGNIIWSVAFIDKVKKKGFFDAPDFINGGLLQHENILYVTGGSNAIRAIDIESGKVIWSRDLLNVTRVEPVIAEDKILIKTIDSSLYALDKRNGEIIWMRSNFYDHISIISSIKPLIYKKYVLLQSSDDEVSAINLSDGSDALNLSSKPMYMNSYMNQYFKAIQTNMVLDKDILFLNTADGVLSAINLLEQRIVWKKNIKAKQQIYSCGDFLYILDQNDFIIALLKKDGKIKWVQDLKKLYNHKSGSIVDWTAPIMINSKVILANQLGGMIEFDAFTGEVSKDKSNMIKISDGISMPIIVNNNELYVIYEYGKAVYFGN